jgi:hypothetical protein
MIQSNNTERTIEHMRSIKPYGMQKAYQMAIENHSLANLTADELIAHLVAQE